MHGMYSPEQLKKINKPQTRGMRRNWFSGVEALMTVLRVLPPDLYEKVMTGKGDVEPGASTAGAGPGQMMDHGGHQDHGGAKKEPAKKGHEGHKH